MVLASPPLVNIEVVCGGGLLGIRGPTAASDCAHVFRAVKEEALLPAEGQNIAVGDISNVSFSPVGLLSPEGLAVCRDGPLECALYSLTLCAQHLGTSPGHAAIDPPWPHGVASWLNLPTNYFKDLTVLQGADNLYLDYYQPYATEAGYDWGYLTSCARTADSAAKLAAAFRRSAALGAKVDAAGATGAMVVVGGVSLASWAETGAIREAICKAYTGPPPAACQSGGIGGGGSDDSDGSDGSNGSDGSHSGQVAGAAAGAGNGAGAATVDVELLCTGGGAVLHSFCSEFIAEMQTGVVPWLGKKAVNFTLVPAGGILQVRGESEKRGETRRPEKGADSNKPGKCETSFLFAASGSIPRAL